MLFALANRLSFGWLAARALAAGSAALARGQPERGRRLLRMAAGGAPAPAAAAAARLGEHSLALEILEDALWLDPLNRDLVLNAALAQIELGDPTGALRRIAETIARLGERDPGYPLMRLAAHLRMPGPSYAKLLAKIHALLAPRSYVEIGVAAGDSLVLAAGATRAVGIDPAPALTRALPANATLYPETSDAFFAAHDLRALLGGQPVDLAFIDGMHQFEFALRDFINLERHCAAHSTILMDDCCPFDRRSAARERATQFWSGDVWKLVPALKKYRPDLRLRTVAAAPTGLCMIRGLDPASRVLQEHYDAVVAEFGALDYGVLEADRAGTLNLMANDWDEIQRFLA